MALADYIDNKPTIETPRLRIRPMCKADVPALMEWMPDKTIYKYWGKGPGKTDKKPELLFDVRNIPSQRMLEKCGFQREGLIRQGKMVSTWCDYYIYGILSGDLK